MIQGGLLAYLLIRLSGADREVMEKWLYVIVGLTFIAGILGTAHHYFWIGVPQLLAAARRILQRARAAGLPRAWRSTPTWRMRRSGLAHPTGWRSTGRSGARSSRRWAPGILGLAHTWPSVNQWTHGTMITAMHGHMAFFGAYVMIVLAMITYAAPGLFGHDQEAGESPTGLWAFWLQMAGMFGMTMAFAAAGIGQTYLERILGLGYLETQQKIQVHFLMVLGTGLLFVLGVALYLYDFFFLAPKRRSGAGRRGRPPPRRRER